MAEPDRAAPDCAPRRRRRTTPPVRTPYRRASGPLRALVDGAGVKVLGDLAPRRTDIMTLGDQPIRGGRISWRQSKTRDMTTPVKPAPETSATMAAVPRGMLWLSPAQGRPRTVNGFGRRFREACGAAGLAGLTARRLRRTHGADAAMSGDGAVNAPLGPRSDSPAAATYRAQAQAMAMADEARARIQIARMESAARGIASKGISSGVVGPEGLEPPTKPL